MRTLLTLLTFIGILVVGMPILFFAVLFVAGPHADLLPQWTALPIAVVAASLLLAVAAFGARRVWRHFTTRLASGR